MKKNEPIWSSLVLGMHDALVSTLGLVTGLAFADATQYIIILTGIIAAVSAGLSMTASEYLSQKAGGNSTTAMWRGVMTGIAYVFTSALLLVPFVLFRNPFVAVSATYIVGVAIIFGFNYLKSKMNAQKFLPAFIEMLVVCFVVTTVAFIIGESARILFGISI
jgi:VIT1/CCC1 family predicted Fe2+/Mn2+ transporter